MAHRKHISVEVSRNSKGEQQVAIKKTVGNQTLVLSDIDRNEAKQLLELLNRAVYGTMAS